MKRKNSALWPILGLAILYIVLLFVLPANHDATHAYNLSALQYHVLLLAIELPVIIIWFIAFYGYGKLAEYATALKDAPEAVGFWSIARGAHWIAWELPIPALISVVLAFITNAHPRFEPAAVIISSYVSLIILLLAFSFISTGSRALATQAKSFISVNGIKILTLLFVVMGTLFCLFTFRHLDLHLMGDAQNPYYLPTWLVVLTLIIPYLYSWLIGLLAAYEILLLSHRTHGVLYKRGLLLLVIGLATIIATSTGLQYYRSVAPRTGHLSLGVTLIVSYAIELAAAIGFILLALGARRLKRIEEV